MLNEDVVKKLKNVPNNTNNEIEKVNTNIETAKSELNTKIDQLIAGGSNVASTQTIDTDDWVDDEENGFKATVTHNLLTQRIVVNIIDATTKENVVTNFRIIDDNSIEIRSETKTELNVYVVNGNAETHFINATVDDNRVSEMTTYSSKKITDSIGNIQLVDTSISITDANNRFTSNKLDGVLEEIMVEISGQRTKGITIANNLIDMI
ncbi:TPA: hypothetical protein KN238_000022 [Clostridioides difficile]|nr:hypothetical protein [Clostridioides difficile]HBF3756593.1 hypothetical protein [Clostridioides difficile]HBF6246930.1 hypothetical protein [Clostridioides difficile]HBY3218683.1 hypothetical protein [Clostridioides difficile]